MLPLDCGSRWSDDYGQLPLWLSGSISGGRRLAPMTAVNRRVLFAHPMFKAAIVVLSMFCAAPSSCGGDGGGNLTPSGTPTTPGTNQNLTESDVNTIVLQAI